MLDPIIVRQPGCPQRQRADLAFSSAFQASHHTSQSRPPPALAADGGGMQPADWPAEAPLCERGRGRERRCVCVGVCSVHEVIS